MAWPAVAGAIAGAVLPAVGDMIGRKFDADQAHARQEWAARENERMQKEFAQQGVRWKVADARAAGLHPLAALGAQTSAANPTFMGDSYSGGTGETLRNMGQDITRAISAGSTQSDRDTAALNKLALERGSLENDLLRVQIARQTAQLGPPIPEPDYQPQPFTPVVVGPGGGEPGEIASHGWAKTGDGGLALTHSKDLKERIEDDVVQESFWNLRNMLVPQFNPSQYEPPASRLPKGALGWKFNHKKQAFYPVWPGSQVPSMTPTPMRHMVAPTPTPSRR